MAAREQILAILREIMKIIPAIEGMIVVSNTGELIAAEGIERIPYEPTAEAIIKIYEHSSTVSEKLKRGELREITIRGTNGYIVIAGGRNVILVAYAGADALSQIGLISLNLRSAIERISALQR